jgi:hypothetical protein
MSQLSKMTQSRDQWKHKAKQRGEHERYQRKQNARLKAQYNRTTTALKATQARLRQLEAQLHGLATVPKVDVVSLALQLFFVARIGFRAVSRVLTLWLWPSVSRKHHVLKPLSIGSSGSPSCASTRPAPFGASSEPGPLTNGLIWMIDIQHWASGLG